MNADLILLVFAVYNNFNLYTGNNDISKLGIRDTIDGNDPPAARSFGIDRNWRKLAKAARL